MTFCLEMVMFLLKNEKFLFPSSHCSGPIVQCSMFMFALTDGNLLRMSYACIGYNAMYCNVWNGQYPWSASFIKGISREYWIGMLFGKIAARRRHWRIFCLHLSANAGPEVEACFAQDLVEKEEWKRMSKADNQPISLKVNKEFRMHADDDMKTSK